MEIKKKIFSGKAKSQAQALVFALLVITFLILANFLSSRHFMRWDLTQDQEYTLADTTKKAVKNLKEPVLVTLFLSNDVPPSLTLLQQGVTDLLAEYVTLSEGKITVNRVDPNSSLEMEDHARTSGIPPLQLDVVAKDKRQVMKVYMGITLSYLDKRENIPVVVDLSQLEYDLTASIVKLAAPKTPKLGLVLPMSEMKPDGAYSLLKQLLQREFEVVDLNYTMTELAGQGLDLLVAIEPHRAPETFGKELTQLFDQGTPLLILAGRTQVGDHLNASVYDTGLEGWLSGMGLNLTDKLVLDTKSHTYAAFSGGMMNYHIPYPFFVKTVHPGINNDHPITSKLESMVWSWTNAVEIVETVRPDLKYVPLIQTTDASFYQEGPPDLSPEALEDMDPLSETVGPKTLAVLVESPASPDKKQSRLIFAASNNFIKNNSINEFEANVLFALNTTDWYGYGDRLIGIRSRGKSDRAFALPSAAGMTAIRLIHIVGIPVVFLLFGLGLQVLRQRKWKKLQQS